MPQQDRDAMIAEFERELGFSLPSGYAAFLRKHTDGLIEPPLAYPWPDKSGSSRVGVADVLLRIEDLAENSRNDVIGLPEKQMMHIGHSLLSPNIYLCCSSHDFGAIYAAPPFGAHELVRIADSFEGFMSICARSRDVEA